MAQLLLGQICLLLGASYLVKRHFVCPLNQGILTAMLAGVAMVFRASTGFACSMVGVAFLCLGLAGK